MQPITVQELIEALESGKYEKGNGCLRRAKDGGDKPSWCCLGVAANLIGVEWDKDAPQDDVYFIAPTLSAVSYIPTEMAQEFCPWIFDIKDQDHPHEEYPESDTGGQWLLAALNDSSPTFDPIIQLLKKFQERTGTP